MTNQQRELREARNMLLGTLGAIALVAVMIINELPFPARHQWLPVAVIGAVVLSVLIWVGFTIWIIRVS